MQAATLVWADALDGGDPKAKAPFRDEVMMLSAPFTDDPRELVKLEQRFVPAGGGGGFRSAAAICAQTLERGACSRSRAGLAFLHDRSSW